MEELRKTELVRNRLEGLDQMARSYPENHHTRVLLENLHLDRALGAVEEDIRAAFGTPCSTLAAPEKPIGLLRKPRMRSSSSENKHRFPVALGEIGLRVRGPREGLRPASCFDD